MYKRIICVLTAITLLAGGLAGCGPGQGEETGKTAGGASAARNPGAGIPGGGGGPKGRYVEVDVKLPGDGLKVRDFVKNGDGTPELYMQGNGVKNRYILIDGTWQKQEDSLLEGLDFSYGLHITYGGDGGRYALFPREEDYQFRLFRITEGEEPKELLENVLSSKNEQGRNLYYPDFFAVTDQGDILLSNYSATEVYTPDGEQLFAMPQEQSSMEWKTAACLDGNDYVTIGQSGYLRYDLSSQNGRATEEIPYQRSDYDLYGAIAPDGNGGLFIANPGGIHHMGRGGSIWETVADGNLNSLSLPSVEIRKIITGSEDDFYVWLSTGAADMVKHYVYDPEMPSVPAQTLTVYGLDLSTAQTIRQAAAMFQIEHPGVRVELVDGQTGAGSTTVSDTIRTLNTELLTGNGADVLVLDGLPVESYIEKGVLEDMSAMLEASAVAGELQDNVLTAFTRADGGVYQIPARMILLTAYGDPAAVSSLKSMEAMGAYQSDPAHLPLRPKTKYENLLRQTLALYYDDIVDPDTGRPRDGKIRELLETVQILGKANGAEVLFDEAADGGMGRNYNASYGMEGRIGMEYYDLDRGQTALALEKIDGMNSLMLPLSVINKQGLTMEGVNASWLPEQRLGINRAGAQKELAEEFIRFTLGDNIQESDLNDGLPVNTRAVERWLEADWGNPLLSVAIGGGDDGYTLSGVFPTPEERAMVFGLAGKADRPLMMDRVLADIIVEETEGFFDGKLSIDQAAQNAENKANLYFSE